MKIIIKSALLLTALCLVSSCSTNGYFKKSLGVEPLTLKYVSKKIDQEYGKNLELMVRYYPDHGFGGGQIIGFLSDITGYSAHIKIFKKDLEAMKGSNKKYVYSILARNQYVIKSVIKGALKNSKEEYPNITFIYVGVKRYKDEIDAYATKVGMSYKFMDIDQL